MSSVALSGSLPVGESTTARAGFGVVFDGEMRPEAGPRLAFDTGGLVFAGLEHNVGEGEGLRPALALSGQAGVTWAGTVEEGTDTEAGYFAADLRFGLRATWTPVEGFFPYIAGRVFGGPASWELAGESVTGTDAHHYQLAVGAAATVGPVLLFAEWAGLGEKGISAGIGTAW